MTFDLFDLRICDGRRVASLCFDNNKVGLSGFADVTFKLRIISQLYFDPSVRPVPSLTMLSFTRSVNRACLSSLEAALTELTLTSKLTSQIDRSLLSIGPTPNERFELSKLDRAISRPQEPLIPQPGGDPTQ